MKKTRQNKKPKAPGLICRLLASWNRDFQSDAPDDFKYRMCVNIAAMIFVVALAGLAAADVLKLERAQWPPAATIIARADLS